MRSSGLALSLAVVLLLAGSVGLATQPAAQAKTQPGRHEVVIENMQFNPAQVTVHAGDRIVWVNKDLFPHTVTALDKTFDSGSIATGVSWSYVARKKGEVAYGCTFHPTMKGTIRVQ
jgi:plastocyanin